jgi:putative hydrolase of the HAD superfamily
MLKYLLFDLDNTLYSCRYGLERNVSHRIKEFTAAFLGTSTDEAWRQRHEVINKYGTCLEWLITEKGLTNTEAYFAAVHPPGEADSLVPDPELRVFLASIPIPKAILTNSPKEHSDIVLEKLGLNGLFTHVFEIRQNSFIGKPRKEYFENALNTLGVSIDEVLFIDDYPNYVQGFIAIGGKALLYDEEDAHQDSPLPRIINLKELVHYISE